MRFESLLKTLERNRFYVFSFNEILIFYPEEKRYNLKRMIARWKKKGRLNTLKRGLYELAYPKDVMLPDMYIANKLYGPSYVSLETALSNYSIIPEVCMAVTSITTKTTRRFRNKHGLFVYSAIQANAFRGYFIEKQRGFNILMAEPEKAVVDYLYFKKYRNNKFSFEEERLDMNIIANLNKRKLNKYAKLFNLDLRRLYAHL